MKLYQIVGPNGVVETKKSYVYKTLGSAKTAAKLYVRNINKFKRTHNKLEQEKLSNYKIIEYELIQKNVHPL